jgi:hypothetical protein
MYAGSFWVATIVLKGVHQETQLETQGDHRPILWLKVPEERHATAEVAYIINAENVEIVEVDLLLLVLLLLLLQPRQVPTTKANRSID